jgi:hypothetical protein
MTASAPGATRPEGRGTAEAWRGHRGRPSVGPGVAWGTGQFLETWPTVLSLLILIEPRLQMSSPSPP